MAGKLGLAAVVFIAVSTGCTTYRYAAYDLALCPADCPETCAAQRNRVNVILVNGVDLLDVGGLNKLGDRINEAGFSQVYCGCTVNCGSFGREMRRVAKEEPDTRFVLVGYECGAGDAVSLAAAARRDGLTVDAVVLLDPVNTSPAAVAGLDAPVHVITSDGWPMTRVPAGAEITALPGVGHFGVPKDATTAARVAELLRESAGRVPLRTDGALILPLIDDPAPLPAIIPGPPGEPAGGQAAAGGNPWVSRVVPAGHVAPKAKP